MGQAIAHPDPFSSLQHAHSAARSSSTQIGIEGSMADVPRAIAALSPEALSTASERTLGHYNAGAESFWLGTRDHDVSQNTAALLRHLPSSGPQKILDFGCGPGRDLITFRDMGHEAVGLDGSEKFAEMARANSGCEVWQQDFLHLALPEERFDGVFANASLFHCPSQELPGVLQQLHRTLKTGGILFSSNPRGPNHEGWSGERYGCYLDVETYRLYLADAGFEELEHFYRPEGRPRHEQPWFASVWRQVPMMQTR